MPRRRTGGLGLVIALVLAACGGSDDAGDRASTRPPASSASPSTEAPPSTGDGASSPVPAPPTTAPAPATTAPPSAPPATTAPDVPARGTPARIRIPTIGVDAPVVDLGTNPDGTLQVPDWQDAGWWHRGPEPGQRGPAVIVGHVDSTSGPAVFHRLRDLVPGDVIEVDLDGGGTARFAVQRTERFAKDDFPTRDVYGLTSGPELRLVTCDGEFDASTGHYVDNLVVFATSA